MFRPRCSLISENVLGGLFQSVGLDSATLDMCAFQMVLVSGLAHVGLFLVCLLGKMHSDMMPSACGVMCLRQYAGYVSIGHSLMKKLVLRRWLELAASGLPTNNVQPQEA